MDVFRREKEDGRARTSGVTGLGKVKPEAKRHPSQANKFWDDITIVECAPWDCITRVLRDATNATHQKLFARGWGIFRHWVGPSTTLPTSHIAVAMLHSFTFFACSHMNFGAPVPPRSGFVILFRLPIDIESRWDSRARPSCLIPL